MSSRARGLMRTRPRALGQIRIREVMARVREVLSQKVEKLPGRFACARKGLAYAKFLMKCGKLPARFACANLRRSLCETGRSWREGLHWKLEVRARIDLFSEIYISRSKAQLKGWNF
ncbi:hypothetical protein QL285_092019 [Trifolium repens]|nr:hypothetical protein QL285_092019 [Trifolium repens]